MRKPREVFLRFRPRDLDFDTLDVAESGERTIEAITRWYNNGVEFRVMLQKLNGRRRSASIETGPNGTAEKPGNSMNVADLYAVLYLAKKQGKVKITLRGRPAYGQHELPLNSINELIDFWKSYKPIEDICNVDSTIKRHALQAFFRALHERRVEPAPFGDGVPVLPDGTTPVFTTAENPPPPPKVKAKPKPPKVHTPKRDSRLDNAPTLPTPPKPPTRIQKEENKQHEADGTVPLTEEKRVAAFNSLLDDCGF